MHLSMFYASREGSLSHALPRTLLPFYRRLHGHTHVLGNQPTRPVLQFNPYSHGPEVTPDTGFQHSIISHGRKQAYSGPSVAPSKFVKTKCKSLRSRCVPSSANSTNVSAARNSCTTRTILAQNGTFPRTHK